MNAPLIQFQLDRSYLMLWTSFHFELKLNNEFPFPEIGDHLLLIEFGMTR